MFGLGILLVAANVLGAAAHAGCAHDKNVRRKPVYAPQPGAGERRSAGFESLRIHFDFDGIEAALPTDDRAYIQKLIEDAGTWLSGALMVQRLNANLKITSDANSTISSIVTVPAKYLSAGVSADVLIFVLAQTSSSGCAGGGTLAYASHFQQDPANDRPLAGYIQMCPQHHAAKTVRGQRDEDFHTALHEILHILGWSDALFPFFRRSDGTPRTPRCATELPAGVRAYSLEPDPAYSDTDQCCASNTVGHPPFLCTGTQAYQASADTVLVETGAKPGLDTVSNTHKLIKTPKVLEVARKHFGCPTLAGVELEDDGGSGSAGSHWEKRQMFTEFMCANPSGFQNVKSSLTLALMEDSGWYKANYSAADVLRCGLVT